ncbi:gustatory and pheromone receptor 32a [Cimex lectularius]|uniref:Gustatory receptor n=1 Tax=Cimex lectularius TaxID=79782 RepID=A0A8I6R8R6_CIMLE|nr:gustatory and pheromone receptor 32a [Cimex lectularius]
MQFCAFLEYLRSLFIKLHLQVKYKKKITNLITQHSRVISMAMVANKLYNVQLLVIFIGLFVNLVSWLYLLVDEVQNTSRSPVAPGLLRLADSMWQICVIYFISSSCQLTKHEAEKFNQALFRLMTESSELCKNGKLQLHLTMNQTINFTACGFFTLGYPLVTSIIAAATTYLVILVQFSMPSN